MANPNRKKQEKSESKLEMVSVTYTDGNGAAQTLDVVRGVERVDVLGGWLVPEWDEHESFLGATFEPVAAKAAAGKHAAQSMDALKAAFLATATDAGAAEAAALAAKEAHAEVRSEIAARIGKKSITIGGNVYKAKRAKDGAKFPMGLVSVSQLEMFD